MLLDSRPEGSERRFSLLEDPAERVLRSRTHFCVDEGSRDQLLYSGRKGPTPSGAVLPMVPLRPFLTEPPSLRFWRPVSR